MDTVQVFTKSQRVWKSKPLDAATIDQWRKHLKRLKFKKTVAHASYLINLCSANEMFWRQSVELMVEEVRRCHLLAIPYLVVHPGAHMGAGEEAGIAKVVASLNVIHRQTPDATRTVRICLELTAGQGSCIGCSLEQLARIIQRVNHPGRLGVCLDTAHLWASGYDFRGGAYSAFRRQLERTLGLARVKVWHLNDSKKDFGSRVDRHDHIGRGKIGREGFKSIVRDKAFVNVPKLFELPPGTDESGRDLFEVDLEALRSLLD